jgi:Tfp pilus assembly protein PilN
MIEINLLPEELKAELKKYTPSPLLKQTRAIAFLILGLLAFLHLGLMGILAAKSVQLNALNTQWRTLQPKLKLVQEFKSEGTASFQSINSIQQLVFKRLAWSKKLNRLSLNLPSGVWLNEISVTLKKEFILKGSVVSLKKEEMFLINQFIDNLKKDADFFKGFSKLEMSSAQSEEIGGYEVNNFVISGVLK